MHRGDENSSGSGILFAVNSSDLTPIPKADIQGPAENLNWHPGTNALVEGQTDAKETAEKKKKLSERGASSVSDHVTSLGVTGPRFQKIGFGKVQPVATNRTVSGRRQNRQVEIAIFANDDQTRAAEKGKPYLIRCR